MTNKFIIMVGVPGSGKSTLAYELSSKYGAEVFSSDRYRLKLFNDINCQYNNKLVFDTLYADLKESLKMGHNCILDATNINIKNRRRAITEAKSVGCKNIIAYVMTTSLEQCQQNDSIRDKQVGNSVIDKFIKRFQCPQYYEGFTDIVFIGGNELLSDYASDMLDKEIDFYQFNPYHIHSLFTHSSLLATKYNSDKEKVEFMAGLYHDIGKLFTQSFDPQGIAHYYNHDSVGAYFLISHRNEFKDLTDKEFLYFIFLVNFHMLAHSFLKEDNAKYKNLMGECWYNNLKRFAQYDVEASGTQSISNELKRDLKELKLPYTEIINKDYYKKLLKKEGITK